MPDAYMRRTEVRIERVFNAPVEEVYRAWVEPDDLKHWIWASLGHEVWAELDLRVGGAYRIYSHTQGGRHQGDDWSGMCGVFLDVIPNEQLTYTLHWDANVGYNQDGKLALDEVVRVTFHAVGNTTRVDYCHLGLPDDGLSANGHRQGVEESFDYLARLLETRRPVAPSEAV